MAGAGHVSRPTFTQIVDPMTGFALGPPRLRTRRERAQVPNVPPEAEAADDSPYPEGGTPEDVLAWVGYDPDRAKVAIVAEHGRGTQRPQLLEELTERTRDAEQ